MSVRERHQRERAARREAILAAAAKVFADHGLEGATVEMVAREAEVAVGTIYLYFHSRDDLFLSLMAQRIGKLRNRYVEILARRLLPADQVRAIGSAYIDHFNESRGLFLAQLAVTLSQMPKRLARSEELERFEEVRRLFRECFGMWRDSVARLLGKARAPDSAAEATRAATVTWAALNGAFLLLGDEKILRDVTGLETSRLLKETFEFQIAAVQLAAKNGIAGASKSAAKTANGRQRRSNASATVPARGARPVRTSCDGARTNRHHNAAELSRPARPDNTAAK